MKEFKSFTAPNGTYIHAGLQEYQLYGDVPWSDALVAVLEIDTDCPGQCFTYFMRGGITEGRMTIEECLRGAEATIELIKAAHQAWPKFFPPVLRPDHRQTQLAGVS